MRNVASREKIDETRCCVLLSAAGWVTSKDLPMQISMQNALTHYHFSSGVSHDGGKRSSFGRSVSFGVPVRDNAPVASVQFSLTEPRTELKTRWMDWLGLLEDVPIGYMQSNNVSA